MRSGIEDRSKFDLSIIVPTFNEEKRILATLLKLYSFLLTSPIAGEIIVVNDPGTDRTAMIVSDFSKTHPDLNLTLVETGIRLGKGGAIRVGAEKARADIVLFMDADLPTELSVITRFYELVRNGDQCVFGTRLGTTFFRKEPITRRILSDGFHLIFRILFGLNYDTQCGVKCVTRSAALEIFQHVTVDRLTYDVDFVVQAQKRGYRIIEVEIPWYFIKWSSVTIWKTTFRMLCDLIAIWLKNLVAEPSLTENEAEMARFYDTVRGDVRVRAAKSLFLPRRIWYAHKDGSIVHKISSLTPGKESARILDVGFGSGNNLKSLLDLGFHNLVGADVSSQSVKFLKQRSRRIESLRADGQRLPFANETFTVIVCSEVIEHLKRPQESLNEFFRILKRDGRVVITTPVPSLLWNLVEAVWSHVRREQLEIHHTIMSRNRLIYLMRASGLEVEVSSSVNMGLLTFIVGKKTQAE